MLLSHARRIGTRLIRTLLAGSIPVIGLVILTSVAYPAMGENASSVTHTAATLKDCLKDPDVIAACEDHGWKAWIDAIEKCLGRALTGEEWASIGDFFNACAPVPMTCNDLVESLNSNTSMSCAQKNAVLKWHRCPYRFKCDEKDVPPIDPAPCAECPDQGIEPPPFPPPTNGGMPFLGALDNPQGQPFGRTPKAAGVDLSNGAIERTMIDLSLPSAGFSWSIGRSYSARQLDSTGAHRDVDNYQGWNWMQISQPRLYYRSASYLGGEVGRLNLVLDGQTNLSFIETELGSGVYRAQGDAAGIFHFQSGSPGLWVYNDTNGNTLTFIDSTFGTNGKVEPLWKIEDPAGNVAYVGSNSSASAALSAGYDSTTQHIQVAYDTNGRVYTYNYSSAAIGSVKRLKSVVVTLSSVEVARVEYDYYGDSSSSFTDPKEVSGGVATGLAGDLKLVRVTLPTSVSGQSITTKSHIRYYVSDSTAVKDANGYKHTLKSIVGSEGVRRYELANGAITATTAYDATISSYSAEYMEYHQPTSSGFNPARYVRSKINNGECNCGGTSINGTYLFAYSWYTGIDEWTVTPPAYGAHAAFRADVTQPDGIHMYQYTDVQGLSTGSAVVDMTTSTTKKWLSKVERDTTTGFANAAYSPAAVDNAASGTNLNTGAMVTKSSGLVQHYVYYSGGILDGYVRHSKISDGNGSASKTLMSSTEYLARTTTLTLNSIAIDLRRAFPAYSWAYDIAQTAEADSVSTPPTGAHRTDMAYTFWSTSQTDTLSLVPKSIQIILPKVALAENGRGDGSSDHFVYSMVYLRKDSTPAFMRETAYDDRTNAVYSFTKYSGGLMIERIVDVLSGDSDIPSGDAPSTVFGISDMSATAGLNQKTLYEYDDQGRSTNTKLYAQLSSTSDQRWTKTYYTKLSDGRPVVLSIPKYVVSGGTTTCYSPVGYSVSNHAGRGEFSATIGLVTSGAYTTTTALSSWINSGQSTANPLTAVIGGTGFSLSQASATLYDNAGAKVTSQRTYTSLSGSPDESTFAYDNMGRMIRSVDPTATINRTNYDTIGRVQSHTIGTNDTGLTGSTTTGTSNMFTTDDTYFDGATTSTLVDGENSYVTRHILHPTSPTGSDNRETNYLNDFRGRAVVVNGPLAPYIVTLYDNRRTIASAAYNLSTGLSASTDPTTTASTGGSQKRLTLSESFFDARGLSWKQIQWEIDQSSGAKVPDGSGGYRHLVSRTVFGPAGEVLQARGSDAHRYNYDRLRRRTHDWTLAYTNAWNSSGYEVYDSIFSAASNATLLSNNSSTGDIVLAEGRIIYDKDKNFALVTATVSRHHDDVGSSVTRGALDNTTSSSVTFTNSSTSVMKGRLHGISASYYDALERPFASASYGDGRGTTALLDFVYNSSAPTSNTSPPSASAVATSTTPAVLLTTRDYDQFGRTLRVHDPKDLKTEYTFDDAGRTTKTRANAVSGTPGTDTVDTYFTYSSGLRTSMWVDADLSGGTPGSGDQVTTYDYTSNLTPGSGNPASLITVNNLLTRVTYPDSGVVKYGYNGLGQQRQTNDQSGNFIDTLYDFSGRETQRTVTTMGSSAFDATLRRIDTTYGDPRGLVTQITQYADTSGTTENDHVSFTYDKMGNLASRTQAIDSFSWESTFAYELHAPDGTNHLRSTYALSEIGYPDVASTSRTFVDYSYVDTGSCDRAGERVSTVSVNRVDDGLSTFTPLAAYRYNGQSELVEQRAFFTAGSFNERSLAQSLDDLNPSSYRTYPNLDAFDRVASSWLRRVSVVTGPTTRYSTFYKTSMLTSSGAAGYDYNSNIIGLADDRWARYSADFAVDGMNRLTERNRTTGTNPGIDEKFGIDRLGNFTGACTGTPFAGMQTDFDGLTIGTMYPSETRTYNTSNQITGRATNCTGTALAPSYDLVGNLVNDDTSSANTGYTYKWDALGRLTEIWNKDSTPLQIAGFRYSADNHRIAWKYPRRTGDDNWYYPVYDEMWRMIALYKREADVGSTHVASLQERFYYHNAGLAGSGNSQYIDSVIGRDNLPDGSGNLVNWMFYAQNWRGDVVGMLKSDGSPDEHVRFTAYGRPIAMTASDWDGDGVYEAQDILDYVAQWSASNPYTDFDLDGQITTNDLAFTPGFLSDWFAHGSVGIDTLNSGSGNRKGYAGYEHDPVVSSIELARYRWFRADCGTWMRRDPIGYAAGLNMYRYVDDNPQTGLDPSGLVSSSAIGGCSSCSISGDTRPARGLQPQRSPWPTTPNNLTPFRIIPEVRDTECDLWIRGFLTRSGRRPNDDCWKAGYDVGLGCCTSSEGGESYCSARAMKAVQDCMYGKVRDRSGCYSECWKAGMTQCDAGYWWCQLATLPACIIGCLGGGAAGSPGGPPGILGGCLAGCLAVGGGTWTACIVATVVCYAGVAAYCGTTCYSPHLY